jgi:hypothetical protein
MTDPIIDWSELAAACGVPDIGTIELKPNGVRFFIGRRIVDVRHHLDGWRWYAGNPIPAAPEPTAACAVREMIAWCRAQPTPESGASHE